MSDDPARLNEDPERLTADEIGRRAGVRGSDVQRLAGEGILRPSPDGTFPASDVRRAILVQTFVRAGVPLDGIGSAVRSGALSLDFADTTSYERFAGLSDVTFEQVAVATGLPVEVLLAVRRATGGLRASATDRVREDEHPVIELARLQLASGFRPEAIERWLLVYGESLRRVAEAEEDYFGSEVIGAVLRAGGSPADAWAQAHELSPALAAASEDALLAVYHAHQARSWTRGILDFVESSLEAAGLHARPERIPAICFLDISGYTRLTAERGDEAAAGVAEALTRIVQPLAAGHGGQAVKWLGDGVMFHFAEPGGAVQAAIDMVEAVDAAGLPPAHVGIDAGPVLFQEGDYFGRTVNVAARVAAFARPGEVLVTREVVDAALGSPFAFTGIGHVDLKGVGSPVELLSVRRRMTARQPAP